MKLAFALICLLAAPVTAFSATLVCLGDSLTAGYGLGEDLAYPALLPGLLPGWKVVNAGISGDTSAGGLKRLKWILSAGPDALFVALGGNDGLRGVAPAETERNLDLILERSHAAGVPVFLAGMLIPSNYGEGYFSDFKSLYLRVARRHHVPLMPFLLEGVAGNPALNQSDGIHPTAEGQQILARHVAAFLRTRLPKALPDKGSKPHRTLRSKGDL